MSDNDASAVIPDFPKPHSQHNSTHKGYTVEARFDYRAPCMIAGQLFDSRWRQVSVTESPIGISSGHQDLLQHGLYGYELAQALRWWLHAQAKIENSDFCLLTRLVEHEMVSQITITATRAIEETGYPRGMA